MSSSGNDTFYCKLLYDFVIFERYLERNTYTQNKLLAVPKMPYMHLQLTLDIHTKPEVQSYDVENKCGSLCVHASMYKRLTCLLWHNTAEKWVLC